MRILIVEDDPAIAEPLLEGLRKHEFEPTWVATGADALNADPGDMVLLDLGLPDLDGQIVCRRLRERSEVPIIVITARSDELDRVTLLELGADDYLVKPFGFRELVARIRAVARRTRPEPGPAAQANPPDVQTIGPIEIDHRKHRVTVNGDVVSLTPKEHALLVHLASDPGAVMTRETLMREVWDEHWWGSTKTLDVHVASLRRKLSATDLIETIRRVGYRLAAGDEAT